MILRQQQRLNNCGKKISDHRYYSVVAIFFGSQKKHYSIRVTPVAEKQYTSNIFFILD
jgi:hypothetical protein